MKLFLRKIGTFSLLTIFGYSILILMWGEFSPTERNLKYSLGNNGHSFLRFKEAKEKRNIDILFLGSSHAYHGFDTRIFEKEKEAPAEDPEQYKQEISELKKEIETLKKA